MKQLLVWAMAIWIILSTLFFITDFDGPLAIYHDPSWGDNINNTAVCTATGAQIEPQLVTDGSNGAIIAWKDQRMDDGDIYAQRLSSAGTVWWMENGTAICTAVNEQCDVRLVDDGAGGAIITWKDLRNDAGDIYAQRTNYMGFIHWAANGIVICNATNEQREPQVISDGAGGAIIAWKDLRSDMGDIYAQRLAANGSALWTANGVVVCNAANHQNELHLISDGSGGAIIVWRDRRGVDSDIYAQRINSTGSTQWTANGIKICNATLQQKEPQLVSDGLGGAIITWQDYRNGSRYDIFAQRINAAGVILWTLNGVEICNTTNSQEYPQLVSDGSGGAIIVWQDERNGINTYDIFCQRVDSLGLVKWVTNGVKICNAPGDQLTPQIAKNNPGGAIIVWPDQRNGVANHDIYGQSINQAGETQFIDNGLAISEALADQLAPQVINQGYSDVIVAWQDLRNSNNDIYAQRLRMVITDAEPPNTIKEDELYIYHFKSNVESTWSIRSNTSWLNMNSTTGNLSGTPNNTHVGSCWINVTATHKNGGHDWHNFTVTVKNRPPQIIESPISSVTEKSDYSFDLNSDDDGQGNITWELQADSDWLSIHKYTGQLSGTPENNDVGDHLVLITVMDDHGGNSYYNYIITVTDQNDMPLITTVDETTAVEDALYFVDYEAEDIDPTGDTLTWHLSSNAQWLTINHTTGYLSGIPDNEDVGTYWVNVAVDDGRGGTDNHNFTLWVSNVNDPPVIITNAITSATEDVLYLVDYDAIDYDPTEDTLTWSMETDAKWLTINNDTGVISGTPDNDDVGIYWVTLTITDEYGGTDKTSFIITVDNVNDPPEITTREVKITQEDIRYSVDYTAVDIDPTLDELTWELYTTATWLTMDNITGLLAGTPTNDDVGSIWINISVDDGRSGKDVQSFKLMIQNVNDPPVITSSDVLVARENSYYNVSYEAVDIDPVDDTLTWSLQSNADWLTINSSSGVISGIPSANDIGYYWVRVSVNDGNGGTDEANFMLTVENINDPPIIEPVSTAIGVVGETFILTMTAFDKDSDNLIWSQESDAQWLRIVNTTGTLYGTPTKSGIYKVNVTVIDHFGGNDTVELTIDIKPSDKNEKEENRDDFYGANMIYISILILSIIVFFLIIVNFFMMKKMVPKKDAKVEGKSTEKEPGERGNIDSKIKMHRVQIIERSEAGTETTSKHETAKKVKPGSVEGHGGVTMKDLYKKI